MNETVSFLPVTKYTIPSRPTGWLKRPQLTKKLNSAQKRQLTIISAPAGYGKSGLMANWATQQGAAWLSLDPGDNDPQRLAAGILTAVRAAPALGSFSIPVAPVFV